MTELNKALLRRIECPSCLGYMTENIYLCSVGHSSCSKCNTFLRECPICRAKMTKSRNYDLEGVAELLYYPCSYEKCKEYIKLSLLKIHQNSCEYQPYPCKLSVNGKLCEWSGTRQDLAKHATENHSLKFWMREESLDRWKENFEDETQIISAHNNLFYINRIVIKNETAPLLSLIYWTVQYIGPAEESKKFAYEIFVYSEVEARKIRITEICQDLHKTPDEIINSGRCSAISVQNLKTFRNLYKSVWYRVTLLQIDDNDSTIHG